MALRNHSEPTNGVVSPPSREGSSDMSSDVAIIGFSFEFPQAQTAEALWDLMLSGRSAVSGFPSDRLSSLSYPGIADSDKKTARPQRASFMERDLGVFDAKFFGFAAEEAAAADPQQRILLETTYRALENAGIPTGNISNSNACVYIGSFGNDYLLSTNRDPQLGPKYASTGIASSMLSNKISTFFNLKGPSVSLDTACSSSLVALHMACECIRSGESNIGIAGGCGILLTSDYFLTMANMGFLSPSGQCHSFDKSADGYGRGEGFGVVILKSLKAAIRDGDTVRAVIRASGVNQNGRTNLAQPDRDAQIELIRSTYRKAQLDISRTRYFESHGTGTAVGDPIEASAMGNVFGAARGPSDPLFVGALKANIGHLEGAAGIAGIIKTILVLEKGIIPPIACLSQLNPSIDNTFYHMEFPQAALVWPETGLRRASVNSFGFGGTNAHVVLDDAFNYFRERGLQANHCTTSMPPMEADSDRESQCHDYQEGTQINPKLFVWSANDEAATIDMVDSYRAHFVEAGQRMTDTRHYLEDVAYTLSKRRTLHSWRAYAVADTLAALAEGLKQSMEPIQAKPTPSAAFVFTGQGAQWVGMSKELINFRVFRDSVFEAGRYLQGLGCEWEVSDALFNDSSPILSIDDPKIAQPLCTILQVGLVDLLRDLNIHPATVVGHSSGEIAAAYSMGAISRESAWRISYYRGLLSGEMSDTPELFPPGAMIAVGASVPSLQPMIDEVIHESGGNGTLSVACVNSPRNTTLSGDKSLIHAIQSRLVRDGIFNKVLKIPVAYHSAHMQRIAKAYEDAIGNISPGKMHGYANMISSVTGEQINASQLRTSQYWAKNLVSPVLFSNVISAICLNSTKKFRQKLDMSHRDNLPVTDFIEIGPHSALQVPVQETLAAQIGLIEKPMYCAVLLRGRLAVTSLLDALGKLHCRGFNVDLGRANICHERSQQGREHVSLAALPKYPFNHAVSYWGEPRVSKYLRFPPHSFNEFLGAPVADWNPLEPRWRHRLTVSSLGWLEDHKVNGRIVFPAAGMIVMAIEAITQFTDGQSIVSYEIRDMAIISVLLIPGDDSAVDVYFSLRFTHDSSNKSSLQASFALFKLIKDELVEICRGSIKAITSSQRHNDLGHNEKLQANYIANQISSVDTSCTQYIPATELYQNLHDSGVNYGPAFQRITRAKQTNQGRTIAEILIYQPEHESALQLPSVVHPATLDSAFQLAIPIGIGSQAGSKSTWVPSYISKMWLAASGLRDSPDGEVVQCYASCHKRSARSLLSSMWMINHAQDRQLLKAEGIEYSLVSDGGHDDGDSTSPPRRLCFDLLYKPDHILLGNERTMLYVNTHTSSKPEPTKFLETLKLYIMTSVRRATKAVSVEDLCPKQPHLHRQYMWMQGLLASSEYKQLLGPPQQSSELTSELGYEAICDLLESTGTLGQIYVNFGKHVIDILRGHTNPLEVLTGGNMLKQYYELFQQDAKFFESLKKYVDLLAHKNPAMRILEVGAGTGATTRYMLDALTIHTSNGSSSRFSEYSFTDVSPSFLEKAAGDYAAVPNMSFRPFDIDKDLASQGFEEGSYDLIVATNVLHIATSLQPMLASLRKLLRRNGKLVIIEITEPKSVVVPFIFGCLPGWWQSSESWRQGGPCANIAQWNRELVNSGFTGLDWTSDDFELGDNHFATLMASSRAEESSLSVNGCQNTICDKPVTIVTHWDTAHCSELAGLVMSRLKRFGIRDLRLSTFRGIAEGESHTDEIILVIQENNDLSIGNIDATQYAWFQQTLTRSKWILWLGILSPTPEISHMSLIHGLARALRQEMIGIMFSTVSLDGSLPSVLEWNIDESLRNFFRGVNSDNSHGGHEPELVQMQDTLTIPRIYECDEVNRGLSEFQMDRVMSPQRFGKANKKLKIRQPGLLETLYFEEAAPHPPLQDGEIEVEVKAVGVNFKDCLVALGRVPEEEIGRDCAGVVVGVGSGCRHQVGDQVFLFAHDAFQGKVRSLDLLAAKIPDGMSYLAASTLPTNFVTAFHALMNVARLTAGESILIHSGAGGTGQAAIQVAKYCGATIFTSVGTLHKKKLLIELYGLSPENILYSRDLSFANDIQRLTHGRGVDVVMNSLAGDSLIESWECVSPYGRFVEIGKWDIFSHSRLPMSQFANNVSFHAVDIGTMCWQRPEIVQPLMSLIVQLINERVLSVPTPLKSFNISEAESALRYLQSGSAAGKVAVEVDSNDIALTSIDPKKTWFFSEQETFVIAGGLGGQGRSIATWMASRGAKNLVLLSRSGPASSQAVSLVENLRAGGVNVYCPQCDISDAGAVAAMADHCKASMPPIKGCIQAAMDVQDSLFERMTHSQWQASLRPKVQGTWNLHQSLPQDLDFFLMFSSVAGIIGATGQSNYATGNVFQDEVARFRQGQGQEAMSLNLATLIDDGWIAENNAENRDLLQQYMNIKQLKPMYRAEVHGLLDIFCRKRNSDSPARSQLVTGLELPSDVRARDLECADWMNDQMFLNLHQIVLSGSTTASPDRGTSNEGFSDMITRVMSAPSPDVAAGVISGALLDKLSRVLSTSSASMDPNHPLHEFGVDSLIAVELRNWLRKVFKVDIAVFEILGGATALELGKLVADKAWKTSEV